MDNYLYVTIGHPHSRILILSKVAICKDENSIKEAKKLRKQVADFPAGYGFARLNSFNPSELFWAIFSSPSDEKPFLCSDNYFWGVFGADLRHEETPRIGGTWYDTGYFDAKNSQYDSPNYPENVKEYFRGYTDYVSSMDNLTKVYDIMLVKK